MFLTVDVVVGRLLEGRKESPIPHPPPIPTLPPSPYSHYSPTLWRGGMVSRRHITHGCDVTCMGLRTSSLYMRALALLLRAFHRHTPRSAAVYARCARGVRGARARCAAPILTLLVRGCSFLPFWLGLRTDACLGSRSVRRLAPPARARAMILISRSSLPAPLCARAASARAGCAAIFFALRVPRAPAVARIALRAPRRTTTTRRRFASFSSFSGADARRAVATAARGARARLARNIAPSARAESASLSPWHSLLPEGGLDD